MKKSSKACFCLSLLASSFSLLSCQNESVYSDKVIITKSENLDSYVKIQDIKELNSIARYDDAVVIITQEGCSSCNLLLGYLDDYIASNHYLIYTVEATTYLEGYNSDYNENGSYALLYPRISVTPTFLFFKSGKIIDTYAQSVSQEKLATFFSEHTYDLNYYSLNTFIKNGLYGYYTEDISEEEDTLGYSTTSLDKKIAEGNCLIIYSWRRCPDCLDLKEDLIYPFFNEHPDIKIYYYEVDGYYLLKQSSNESKKEEGLKKFSNFSIKYFLSDYVLHDELNERTGCVPTLVYYSAKGHETKVYKNDLNPYINSAGYLQYETSFYNEVKKLTSTTSLEANETGKDYDKALKELESKATTYEKSIINAFLKAYLLNE